MAKPSTNPQVPSPEWWKHLRPYNKEKFHRKVRRIMREILRGKDAKAE